MYKVFHLQDFTHKIYVDKEKGPQKKTLPQKQNFCKEAENCWFCGNPFYQEQSVCDRFTNFCLLAKKDRGAAHSLCSLFEKCT